MRFILLSRFGNPISMKSYQEEFFLAEQGQSRAVAKRLTSEIEHELIKLTINSPDWSVACKAFFHSCLLFYRQTLYAARMARDLLWRDENAINLDDFVGISQTWD